jgi:hypothetical protein
VPLSKVTVLLPKVATISVERETEAAFEIRIACVANQLDGNYSSAEHHACAVHLRHGHLNCVLS